MIGVINAYRLMACLRRSYSECLHSLPAFGTVHGVKAIFNRSTSLEPDKTLNWGSFILRGSLHFMLISMQERVHPTKNSSSRVMNHTKPTLGQFYFAWFPLPCLKCTNGSVLPRTFLLISRTAQNLHWGNFVLHSSLYFVQHARMGPSHQGCVLYVMNHMKP